MEHVCNLLIPGAGKSGTSSLHELLDQHPRVCMSSVKEPHYLAKDSCYKKGVRWHNNLFGGSGEELYFGESSTLYMPCERAIDRARTLLFQPKIIFVLRHPVDRCISHYKWLYRLGHERRFPLLAFEEDGYGLDPEVSWGGNYKSYLQFSNYARYVPIWKEAFGAANVLVFKSDDLKQQPQRVMERCFSFLGIDNMVVHEVLANQTNSVVRVVPPTWLRHLDRLIPSRVTSRGRYKSLNRLVTAKLTFDPPWVIDESITGWLKDALQQDIQYFETVGS